MVWSLFKKISIKKIPSVEVTVDDIDDNFNLDKARTIEEICETIPELIHYPHFKTLRCNLCAEEGMENFIEDYHWTGLFKYNKKTVSNWLKLTAWFRYT